MASGRVERIKEMRNQIPGHRLRYYADAVDAGLSIEDVKAGRVETWMGVAKADLLRERDEARAERDALAAALEHLERLATTIAADALAGARGLQTLRSGALYDVPPDGQLAQDVHRVTNRTLQPSRYIHEDYNKSREAAARLRAAFRLDEGSE